MNKELAKKVLKRYYRDSYIFIEQIDASEDMIILSDSGTEWFSKKMLSFIEYVIVYSYFKKTAKYYDNYLHHRGIKISL